MKFFSLSLLPFFIWNCSGEEHKKNYRPTVAVSSEIIAGAAEEIGGEFIAASKISGFGPYISSMAPSPKETALAASSDILFFDSLDSGERLAKLIRDESMVKWSLYPIFVSSGVKNGDDPSLKPDYDPCYHLDADLWARAVSFITDNLVHVSEENERIYRRNEEQLLMRISETDKYIFDQTAKIPEEKRIIVTSGNTFLYFARRYGFQNVYLVKTSGKASVLDFARMADFIKKNGIKTIFAEYAMPSRNMEILKNNLSASGYEVKIGGPLYSYASGGKTYAEMMTHNIDVIKKAIMEEK